MTDVEEYIDSTERAFRIAGGRRLIPLRLATGDCALWTTRGGDNPRTTALPGRGAQATAHRSVVMVPQP